MRRWIPLLAAWPLLSVWPLAPDASADEPGAEAVDITGGPAEAEPVAEEEPVKRPNYTRNGWYVQAQGVYAIETFKDDNPNVGNDAGFNVLFGWRGWQLFAGEFEFEWIDRFPGKGAGEPDVRTYVLALPFRIYPLARLFAQDSWGNRIQPYLKAGPGWQWAEQRGGGQPHRDRGDFSPRFGAGVEFYVTPKILVTAGANYQFGISDVDNYRYVTVGGGLKYRFGSFY